MASDLVFDLMLHNGQAYISQGFVLGVFFQAQNATGRTLRIRIEALVPEDLEEPEPSNPVYDEDLDDDEPEPDHKPDYLPRGFL